IFVTHDQEEALTMSDRIAVMNGGRVLQIGGPREIYDHPADRFVAGFIGDTNFLSGSVVGHAANELSIELGAGKMISVQSVEGVAESVTLAVRPEHARLCPAGDGLLSGVLAEVVYFGTDTHFHVALEDGTPFVLRQQNAPDARAEFSSGERVDVSFPGEVAQVLRD
ncbi:MAG: TOBE domain-containing protein, partial [Phaeobacter italicus]